MDTLHAQKENVDGNVVGISAVGKVRFTNTDKFSTPKRGFVIHEDSKSTGKKELDDKASKNSRRALSDISNKQRDRHGSSSSSGILSSKKAGLGKGLGHSKKLSAKKRTPLKTKSGAPRTPKARASITPKPWAKQMPLRTITTPVVEEVPDIEVAYGGLSLPESESAHAKDVFIEIQEILNDETPTLFDDFDPTCDVDDWDDSREEAMLESGEPPSPWWASPILEAMKKAEGLEEEKDENHVEDDLSELPPPDNLLEGATADFDDDGLLEDLLSVDVEAVCSE